LAARKAGEFEMHRMRSQKFKYAVNVNISKMDLLV